MNKLITMVLLMAAASGLAQERGGKGHMRDLSPEQMATQQTKKMTLALDLSEAQQSKIQALHLENAEERKAKMAEHQKMKEEGERKKPTSEERYAIQNARLDKMIAQKVEMKKILSDEQYAKWEKMHHGKRKHRHGKKGKKSTGK